MYVRSAAGEFCSIHRTQNFGRHKQQLPARSSYCFARTRLIFDYFILAVEKTKLGTGFRLSSAVCWNRTKVSVCDNSEVCSGKQQIKTTKVEVQTDRRVKAEEECEFWRDSLAVPGTRTSHTQRKEPVSKFVIAGRQAEDRKTITRNCGRELMRF